MKNPPYRGQRLYTVLAILTVSTAMLGELRAQTYLIDFGGAGVSNQPSYGAIPTTSPTNGNYWNNSAGGVFGRPSDITNMVTTGNQTNGVSLVWTNWGSGVSSANMGVTNIPAGSALFSSPLNVATAVGDSVFTDKTTNTNSLCITGLNPAVLHQISIFASRVTNVTRSTLFQVAGSTTLTNTIQTSGADLSGPGLHYSTTPWTFTIAPDNNGQITINYRIASGGFAYLNAMSLTVTTNPSVTGPAPYLVDFGGIGNTNQTGIGLVPVSNPDANGNQWNNSAGGNYGRPANISGMINAAGQTSPISLVWLAWGSGVGAANFGVSNVPPSSALASSPLNTPAAVQDGVFTQDRTNYNSFVLKGLNPAIKYTLGILASRATTDDRYTDYSVTGADTATNRVQTSGNNLSGIGLHYSSTPATFTVAPSVWGELTVSYRAADIGTNYAYINALSLLPTSIPSGNPTNQTANTLFGRWAYDRGWTNSPESDPFADTDGNGMANIVEYGLAAGSNTPATVAGLLPAVFPTNGYLAITYRQRTNDPSMSVRAEYATNMAGVSWQPEGSSNGPVPIATNALAGGTGRLVTVRAPEPMSAKNRGFLRVAADQRLLVVGSSIMNRWTTMEQDLAPVPVLKQAVDGSRASEWVPGAPEGYWDSRVVRQRNPAVMVYLGSNDIAAAADRDLICSNIYAFLDGLWAVRPEIPVLYVSIIRSPLKAANNQAGEVDYVNSIMAGYAAVEPRFRFVDVNPVLVDANGSQLEAGLFLSDSNHLTAAGYAKITTVIKPEIEKLWNDRAR